MRLPSYARPCDECRKPLGTASHTEACVHFDGGEMYAVHPRCCTRCPKRESWVDRSPTYQRLAQPTPSGRAAPEVL